MGVPDHVMVLEAVGVVPLVFFISLVDGSPVVRINHRSVDPFARSPMLWWPVILN